MEKSERYNFPTSEKKVAEFLEWLEEQQEAGKIEVIERQRLGKSLNEAWGNLYIRPRR